MSDLAQERQLQRLKYIDLCAYVLGFINRKSLMNRFEVKEAWATRDFGAYQELSGDRLIYDHAMKGYRPADWFSPLYNHQSTDAIQLLSEGSQKIVCEEGFIHNSYSYSIKAVEPKLDKIYNVLRALNLKKKVYVEYLSRSSGKQQRLIAPHSLIRTGCFEYVRAFDHKSGEFRTFKLNRIISSKLVDHAPSLEQEKSSDHEWNQLVTLHIVANEGLTDKEAIEYDFGLINGELTIVLKKAMIMYFLMDWNIAPMEFSNLPPILFPLKLVAVTDT